MGSGRGGGRQARRSAPEPATTRDLAARATQSVNQAGGPEALGPERLLTLQRAAGNRAVCSVLQRCMPPSAGSSLQRKVKLGDASAPWLNKKSPLPKMPASYQDEFSPATIKKAKELAQRWVGDDVEQGRTFADADVFYRTVFSQVTASAQTGRQEEPGEKAKGRNKTKAPKQDKPGEDPAVAVWDKIVAATEVEGNVTELPWSSFTTDEAGVLGPELLKCGVQISSNAKTTACHGNDHKKLPKQVNVSGFKELREVPSHQQPAHTSYIEFLVPGHKSKIGIERAILDKDDGLIYITRHYTEGSFVLLSGAPDNLVQDWTAKAEEYCRILTED